MSLQELEKLQIKKLRGFLRLVYNFHPRYRRLMKNLHLKPEDFKKFEDLKKFPLTYKNDWVGRERDFILTPNKKVLKYVGLKEILKSVFDREKLKERIKYEYLPATFFATSGRTENSAPVFTLDTILT